MEYMNIYEYIAKNMESFHGEFSVFVTDVSEKEPDLLRVSIHPANKNGETADFYLHADGREEYITTM